MTPRRLPGLLGLLAVVVLIGVAVVWLASLLSRPSPPIAASGAPSSATSGTSAGPGPSVSTVSPQPGARLSLAGMLALVRVAPEDRAGYDRDLFPTWLDADEDGCWTRREVLIEESVTPLTVGRGCRLEGGSWVSVYDGQTFTDSSLLEIDHVVALAEAWDSGASSWTTERRAAFANDLGQPWELAAVSSASNQEKGNSDPADWLPPSNAARCPYLADYLAVKARWELTVDRREQVAIAREIETCPGLERSYEPAAR